jgi:hypothetical protein
VLGLLAGALVLGAALGAAAEDPGRINVDVLVAHISQSKAPSEKIDARARRLDAQLRQQFRYESMQVLERHRMVLALDEVGTVVLPNGHRFRARPLDVSDRGVLMAVGVEDTIQTDIRVPSGHLVVIGAEPYRDGKLVISIEPRY